MHLRDCSLLLMAVGRDDVLLFGDCWGGVGVVRQLACRWWLQGICRFGFVCWQMKHFDLNILVLTGI